ncbi:hypothetical protein J437_LFUL004209 [Ladona fulva]|uniref:Transposable element P transposase n=1 Tax=Ladona fulva TaxID=123851 RepID=A0A8K0K209_LADFU|nr:hypothetical protein J437_LFUL004209 [Ladona fulva]
MNDDKLWINFENVEECIIRKEWRNTWDRRGYVSVDRTEGMYSTWSELDYEGDNAVAVRRASCTLESTLSSMVTSPPGTSTLMPSATTSSRSPSLMHKGVRRSILRDIGMTLFVEMTPKKKVMYQKLVNDHRKINYWKKLAKKYKTEFIRIQSDIRLFRTLEKTLSPSGITILTSILRAGKKRPKGRRWTEKEKVIALSIFKQSPKTYKVLRSLFPLPSKRTLTKFLSNFPFLPGINLHIFKQVASFVEKLPESHRYCTLMFDEMAIKPDLVYLPHIDMIVGYEDHGNRKRRNVVAKVAMVFMVRGVWANWKQPLAYYLSAGGTSSAIKCMIEEVLVNVNGVGLNVVATVCDMGSNNVKALKLMGATYSNPWFDYGGHTVVTIFDPPHLLKSFRNLLMKYDMEVPVALGGQEVTLKATWKHLEQLYEDDGKNPFGRLFYLTEKHVNPKGFAKMRVILAAQVFSRLVGLGLSGLVAKGLIGSDGLGTADVFLSLNDLFDSLNGDAASKIEEKRRFKCPMTRKSHHHKLFTEMNHKISRWKFIDSKTGKQVHPPSQKGWLATIKGVQLLWQRFWHVSKYFNTRSLNQDPLENLFNVVRQNCGCNHHPNAKMFMAALKTSIINGLLSSSKKGNCEADNCNLLTDINDIMSGVFSQGEVKGTEVCRQSKKLRKISPVHLGSIPFIAACVAEDIMKNNSCEDCQSYIISSSIPPSERFISFEISEKCIICPTEELVLVTEQCMNASKLIMEKVGYEQNICHRLATELRGQINFSFFKCNDHKGKVHRLDEPSPPESGLRYSND